MFFVILLIAYGYDTNQKIQSLTNELSKFDQEISNLENKFLGNLKNVRLADEEISKLQNEYQKLSLGEARQGIFTEIVLRVNLNKQAFTSGDQAIIDSLDGLTNRRKIVVERRADLARRLQKNKDSLGAKLIFY